MWPKPALTALLIVYINYVNLNLSELFFTGISLKIDIL